jgi:hypothetical protein
MDFEEEAKTRGCQDVRAAHAVAVELGYMRDGQTDWPAMYRNHPALFAGVTSNMSAGCGQTPAPDKPPSINDMFRLAAGTRRKS